MGLAASQARFLGITLRKANCEFQSTQLAEERLRVSNQLSDISQEYSNAMNATKLLWVNDLAAADYGLTYSLLMMPSAVNDYNPYFVSSKSGAIVLNSNYAAAARAAGIGMAGCVPSETQRNAFIKALGEDGIEMATKETVDRILNGVNSVAEGNLKTPINWDRTAGMGSTAEDKGAAQQKYLADIINDKNIGGVSLDWLQMYTKTGIYTQNEINIANERFITALTNAKNKYLAAGHSTSNLVELSTEMEGFDTLIKAQPTYKENGDENTLAATADAVGETNITSYIGLTDYTENSNHSVQEILREFKKLEYLVEHPTSLTSSSEYAQQLENLKKGLNKDGKAYKYPEKYGVCWAYYNYIKNQPNGKIIAWGDTTQITNMTEFVDRNKDTAIVTSSTTNVSEISMETLFQTNSRNIEAYNGDSSDDNNNVTKGVAYQMTVLRNGVIQTGEDTLKDMTIGDLLTDDIVIMNWWHSAKNDPIEEMSYRATKLMEYIAKIFGYGDIGSGLNVDDTTDKALTQAFDMVKKKYLNSGSAIITGSDWSTTSPTKCSAFNNANDYNRIGSDQDADVAAVNLSNMVSAFLTYYDNYLRETGEYYVGKSNDDTNNQQKTYFVTDDPYYTYITVDPEQMTNDQKIASFYDELYNNLCAKGWREDGAIDQYDYLESTIKDGRYQLMSLNQADGYFYQTRYNETGYMQEVKDEDAITRAEAAYTQKKAELSYKEDIIDMKTKKLDAEIAELNTEISSVQNMISKSIEKTFNMFQS